jgi:hypothetical protein
MLSNDVLLGALRSLSVYENPLSHQLIRVNYAALNVEEFGSVYEGLLEYQPTFLPNGDLLTTLYGWMEGDNEPSGYTPTMRKSRSMLLRSTNRGRHWELVSTIAVLLFMAALAVPATRGRHVNVLRSMVARHYPKPHRFILITDDAVADRRQLPREVEVVPLWNDHAKVRNPMGGRNPSCYRRLKMFATEARDLFGERFVCIDLDVVITGDLQPLFDRPEDFVIWGDTHPRTFYNGSMWMMTAGARHQVWDEFDPLVSPQLSKAAGHFGSDQGWISYRLGPNEATWGRADGVYSYRVHLAPFGAALPDNAKIVVFHGKVDPWSADAQRHAWVREHYR